MSTTDLTRAADEAGVSIDAFALAACMTSEVGGRPYMERLGVGQAVVEHFRRARQGIAYGLTNGTYERGMNDAGRWASTARGPDRQDLDLALLLLGPAPPPPLAHPPPTDFIDPAGMRPEGGDPVRQGGGWVRKTAADEIKLMAGEGKQWIGPVAGIDPRRTLLFHAVGRGNADPAPAIAALSDGGQTPPKTSTPLWVVGLALAGLGLILWSQ